MQTSCEHQRSQISSFFSFQCQEVVMGMEPRFEQQDVVACLNPSPPNFRWPLHFLPVALRPHKPQRHRPECYRGGSGKYRRATVSLWHLLNEWSVTQIPQMKPAAPIFPVVICYPRAGTTALSSRRIVRRRPKDIKHSPRTS